MTKHRRTRRRTQKGGFLGFGESDPNAPTQSWGDYFKSLGTSAVEKTKEVGSNIDTGLGNLGTKVGEGFNSINPFSSNDTAPATSTTTNLQTTNLQTTNPQTTNPQTTSNQVPISTQGGRRRRRARSMKGGNNGSGLVQYAAPVSGLKVAEPTSWQYYVNGTNQYSVKGGSRRRRGRKSRRTRRHKRR